MKIPVLNALPRTISENFGELLQFLRSTAFSKAILIGIAITVPIVLGIWLDHFEIGLALCFGAFWSSPSDVSGSYRHKKIGILFSAVLVMVVSFNGGYLKLPVWILVPVLGLLTFGIAYISVYGFRASLISFSGLLALVLSFAHDPQELQVYQYALLIGVGGLWYLLLAMLWHHLNPKGQTEEVLTETYTLTADFLETRGKLVGPQPDRKALQAKLHELQGELISNHETLRDILIMSRKTSGRSVYENKRLLVFVKLVEILETAIANPVNYAKMDALLIKHPTYVESFQNLIFGISDQLREIAEAGTNKRKFPENKNLAACLQKIRMEVAELKKDSLDKNLEGFLMLQNLLEYWEKQFDNLKNIKWILGNSNTDELEFIDKNAAKHFIAPQDYDPKVLLRNFSFKSTIFKHALRLSVTVMIGYIVGILFDFQNPYWILLTIIVILRPSYGLTKTRSKDRIIGTLIGGAIATGVVFLVQNPYFFGVLGISTMVIALSMVQKNYKTSATFITLSVIFIYAIIRPDVLTVIQYRILDTVIGAALAFLATLWLWPAWGFLEIRQSIETSVGANKKFLCRISDYYTQKGKVPTSYRVARKEAFLQTSNLSATFQRMAQEPRSKQKNLDEIYELVVLNHTFLSALASLSTYIQYHSTTEASERFQTAIDGIDRNLGHILDSLQNLEIQKESFIEKDNLNFNEYLSQFHSEKQEIKKAASPLTERNLQEAHLILEQLRWLFSTSRKMLSLTTKITFD